MAREITQDGTGFGERVLGHVGEFVFDFVFSSLGPGFGVFDVGADFLAELSGIGVGVAFDVIGHSEDAGLRVDFSAPALCSRSSRVWEVQASRSVRAF